MLRKATAVLLAPLLFLVACGQSTPTFPAPDQDYSHLGISDAEASTLLSLEQIDDYPLYAMHQYAEYSYEEYKGPSESASVENAWACTLFAALAAPDSMLFGRNFDWRFSPSLVLFADPGDGYASIALVDIDYLDFTGDLADDLTSKPLEDLVGLLDAHHIPLDGMNEAGLAIAMAAVPAGDVPFDPDKQSIGSLGVIRAMLDQAATVAEAIELFETFNIDFEGGPPLHYLLADAHGDSALVEYFEGAIRVIRPDGAWHAATNFLASSVESPEGKCWRHDIVAEKLEATNGELGFSGAFQLLEDVSQADTQYSVVYDMSSGEVHLAMGRAYEQVHSLELDMSDQP